VSAVTAPVETARAVAEQVVDPEMPMLTLADLGVLRDVEVSEGRVTVTVTPTYSGCPAMATIRADLAVALRRAGFEEVDIRTALTPAWTTDWISERGRNALREHGIAPPGAVRRHGGGPVELVLLEPPAPECPRCGSGSTREVSRFGASSCTSLHVCGSCAEPFDKVKEL
jgi:ring-1,2-phenylacetyl-CoA epoxidase subunit PaaD